MTPSDIIAAARAYEGAPWKHQGRAREGLDCLGLIVCVAIDLNIPGAERFMGAEARRYGRMPPNQLARELAKAGLIHRAGPAPGLIGLFAQPGTYPSHVGIFGDGEMIHADARFGKVVRHRYDNHWRDALRATFAYPGIE